MARTGLEYAAKNLEGKFKSYLPRENARTFLLFTYNSMDNTYYICQHIEEIEVWSAPCPIIQLQWRARDSFKPRRFEVFLSYFCPFVLDFLTSRAFVTFCRGQIFLLQIFCSRCIFITSFSLVILLWNPKNRVKICIFLFFVTKTLDVSGYTYILTIYPIIRLYSPLFDSKLMNKESQ